MKLEIKVTTESLMDAALIEEAILALHLKRTIIKIGAIENGSAHKGAKRGKRQMQRHVKLRLTDARPELMGVQFKTHQALIKIFSGRKTMTREKINQLLSKENIAPWNSVSSAISVFVYQKGVLEIVE